MQDVADQRLETLLDNSDYNESQLIEIRVALNMPYQQRFTEYERHYGEIEIDGKSYTYVKRKIAGDVAIFKCIANKSKQELKAIKNDWAKANSGIETDHPAKQKQQSSFAKNFWSEYDGQNISQPFNDYFSLTTILSTSYSFFIPEVAGTTPHQPPEC
jgi:CRISPR/Cas system endoribonuclease Cas6 (RAMP superfamily)